MTRTPDDGRDDGFLSRWARRKAAVRQGSRQDDAEPAPQTIPAPSPQALAATAPQAPAAAPAPVAGSPVHADDAVAPMPPQMDEVGDLTPASDFSRFVRPDVDPAVGNAALKKLFADPRFNVIDEMDIDIMDYGRPDPLPLAMLRRMASARALGLFRDDEAADAAPARVAAAPPTALNEKTPPDENADLRLQPDDAAGHEGDRPDPEGDAGGQR